MLSLKTKKYLIRAVRVTFALGAAPYTWNKATGLLETTNSRARKIFWYINFVSLVVYESFLIFRHGEASGALTIKNGTYFEKLSTREIGVEILGIRYKAICWFMPVAFQVATLVRWEEFADFVNMYLRFFENMKDKFIAAERQKLIRNSSDGVVGAISFLCYTIAVLQSVASFKRPEQSVLFSSLFANPKKLPPAIKIPIACLHSYHLWCLASLMQLYIFAMMAYVAPSVLIAEKLGSGGKFGLRSPGNHERINFSRIYRSMQLLHRYFTEVYSKIEIPSVKVACMGGCILGSYGFLRMGAASGKGLPGLAVAIMCAIILKSNYTGFAKLYSKSKIAIESWEVSMELDSVSQAERFRETKSFQLLSTSVGIFYKAETKMIVLIIFEIILDQLISLLVAF